MPATEHATALARVQQDNDKLTMTAAVAWYTENRLTEILTGAQKCYPVRCWDVPARWDVVCTAPV